MVKKSDNLKEVKSVVVNRDALCRCGNILKASSDSTMRLVELFEHVFASGHYNYEGCRIPVSNLNIQVWRDKLRNYEDNIVCDFLQYGFPLDFNKNQKLCYNERRNHKGARDYPQFIDKYFERECGAQRIAGPFVVNPLSVPLVVSLVIRQACH